MGWRLTRRSTGRAGSWLLLGMRRRGAPVTLLVRPHGVARMTNASSASAVIRAAATSDVAAITRCVCAAYLRHIERVGKQPWPMLQDYSNVIRTSQVLVAEREGRILGVLELLVTDEGFLLDSVAVDPTAQGTGIGRQMLE